MDQEQNVRNLNGGPNLNASSIVLSALSIVGNVIGLISRSPILKTICLVLAVIFVTVSSFPERFCLTTKHLEKLNKIINFICFIITVFAIFFSLTGGVIPESCGQPSQAPVITPTPTPEIPDPSGKIAAGNDFSMLLRSDKRVVTYGQATGIDTSSWENIIQISAYKDHAVGLREDSTILITGKNVADYDVSDWSGIRQVVACKDGVIGVTMDGRIVFTGPNKSCIPTCQNWKGIERIIGAACIVVAERYDGSLIATDEYIVTDSYMTNLEKRIVSGAAVDDRMLFVLDNGRVKATGTSSELEEAVATWADMLQVAAGDGFAVGLTNGGKVIRRVLSSNKESDETICTDAAAICTGGNYMVILMNNGIVLTDGSEADGLANIANENYWVSN